MSAKEEEEKTPKTNGTPKEKDSTKKKKDEEAKGETPVNDEEKPLAHSKSAMERLKEEQEAANMKNPSQTSIHNSAKSEIDKAARKLKKQAS